jgi:outer membrane protein OmpA-like peptidoglycan-associated protein
MKPEVIMKNIILGWLIALSGISLSFGSVFYHQSNKNNSSHHKLNNERKDRSGNVCEKPKPCPLCKKAPPCPVVASTKVAKNPQIPDPSKNTKDSSPLKTETPNNPDSLKTVMTPDVMVVKPLKKEKKSIVLYFTKNSLKVSRKNADIIKDLAKDLSDFKFKIGIRTGDKKSKSANSKFAKNRARRIRKILHKAGIPLKRISYRVFAGDPEKHPDKNYKSRYWRRGRVTAIPGGK